MVRLNLLPWRERRRLAAVRRFQASVIGAVLLALCGLALLDQLSRQRLQLQASAHAQVRADLERVEAHLTGLALVNQSHAELRDEQALLARLHAGRGQAPGFFEQLERAMPPGLHLTGLSLQEDQVLLVGVAASGALVAQLMRSLQTAQLLRDVDLQQLKSEPQGEAFRLSARLQAPWS